VPIIDSFITPDDTAFDFGTIPVRRQVILYAEKFVGPRGYLLGSELATTLAYKRRLNAGADLIAIDWEGVAKQISPKALALLAHEVRQAIRDGGFTGRVLCTGLLSEGQKSRWWAFQDQLAADRFTELEKRVEPFVPAIREHDGIAYQLYVPYADVSNEGLSRLRCWLHGSADLATRAIGVGKLALPMVAPRFMSAAPPQSLRLLDPPIQKAIARFVISRGFERVGLWDWAGPGYEVPGLTIAGTIGMIGAAVRQLNTEMVAAAKALSPDPEGKPIKMVEAKPSGVKVAAENTSGA